MRLSIKGRPNSQSMYIIKSTYENGASSSKVVRKLGTMKELKEAHADPIAWGKSQVELLNAEFYKGDISVTFSQTKKIEFGFQNSYNGGYLFLQKIYNELGIGDICGQYPSNTGLSLTSIKYFQG